MGRPVNLTDSEEILAAANFAEQIWSLLAGYPSTDRVAANKIIDQAWKETSP